MSAEQKPTDTQGEPDDRFRRLSSERFLTFADGIKIPSADGPQVFRGCMADFQREFFHAIAPSLHAVRDGTEPVDRRFWMERTKKAGKDSDLAVCLMWLMAFAARPLLVQVCAANQKQASIIKRRVESLLHYNSWLNDLVVIQQNRILSANRLGEICVEATESAGGAHGETPDLLILNELVHVAKWSVMETHMNNADGVPRNVTIVSTNAGFKGTEADTWRELALAEKDRWQVFRWSQPAPWVNPADVEEARKRNIGSEYSRLWMGRWVSGKGDALSEDDIDRVFRADLRPLFAPEDGWRYVAAADLGTKHDHAACTVVGVNSIQQRIRVAQMHDWAPQSSTGEVDLIDVENTCFAMHQMFQTCWFGYDPAEGGSFMAQNLARRGLHLQEVRFVPKSLTEMAESLVQVMHAGKLECYEDETLRRDFGKFYIKEKNYGYRLEAVSDSHGHADVGTALVICLPTALKMLAGGGGQLPDDYQFVLNDDVPLTEKEVKEMPDVLRGIYEMDGEEKVRMVDMSGREIRR